MAQHTWCKIFLRKLFPLLIKSILHSIINNNCSCGKQECLLETDIAAGHVTDEMTGGMQDLEAGQTDAHTVVVTDTKDHQDQTWTTPETW